jgi:biopolymer transport protein ExbD
VKFGNRHRKRLSPNLDLTPMIDVVFQLILFFMLSSTIVVQTSIQIEMPEAEGATELEEKDLSVTLAFGADGPGGKGKIYVNNDEIPTIEALTNRLSQEVQARPHIQLLVRTDSRTDTGRLVEVLGIATSVGIEKYGISAQPPDAGQ